MSNNSEKETDAYCPTCEKELLPSEYDDDTGCNVCGTENLWLSQPAFSRIFKKFVNENEQELSLTEVRDM